VPRIEPTVLDATLARFRGTSQQVPPMYSAIKRDGQPLYKLARAGVEVERAPREIEIFDLAVLGHDEAHLELEASCSKGTYIRTLAEDLAKALGTCGHVAALRRLHVEPFGSEPMVSLEALTELAQRGESPALLAPDRGVLHLPAVHLSMAAASRVTHGQSVNVATETAAGRVRLYDGNGQFFGIGESDGTGQVRPRRLFA
jgi:tRNA pseudouridine55 synthase